MSTPCPFEDEILALDDATIPPLRRAVLEAHLGVCPGCARIDETLDIAQAAWRAVPAPRLGAAQAALGRIAPRSRLRGVPLYGAIAAAAAAVVALRLLVAEETPERPAPAPVEIARDTTPVDAARDATAPDEVARDPAPSHDVARGVTPDELAGGVTPPHEAESPHASRDSGGRPDEQDSPARTLHEETRPRLELPSLGGGPSVAELVASIDLASESRARAAAAAAERVRTAGAGAAAALAGVLASRDPETVERALAVSRHVASLQLVPALERLLAHERFAPEAARQLGALRAESAVPALAAALDGVARPEAIEALAAIGTRAALDVLAERFRRGGRHVPTAALLDAAVCASPAHGARLLLDAASVQETALDAALVLAERSEALLPHLRRLARGGDALIASAAAGALGRVGDVESIDPLAELAKQPGTARAATTALLAIGSRDAVQAAFHAAARGPAGAAASMSFHGATIAEPVLLDVLERDSLPDRRVAVRLLGACGGPAACAVLAELADDPNLAADALTALGDIGGDAAAGALARFADSRALRPRLATALGATASPRALPLLARLVAEPAATREAARALGEIHDRGAVLLLVALLEEPRGSDEAAASLAYLPARLVVPELLSGLDHPRRGPRLRRVLARIAGADHGAGVESWRKWWESRP